VCGCGAGDAGCEECGCCKVCAGDLDPHEMINHDNSIDDDIEYIYEDGREDVKARMDANEIEIKRKVKKKKKKQKKDDKKKGGSTPSVCQVVFFLIFIILPVMKNAACIHVVNCG